ncbi:MAG: site-2 protease family protein [Planctomycetaceae bacterium]|jgi:membrane-associated protease RseP (regulator of RpoE activity)|nr:site-2 protease family protein [Planctomycetaceae bacterium]
MIDNWKTPLLLFLATFVTTTFCRFGFDGGLLYQMLLSSCLAVLGADTPVHWNVFRELLWQSLLFSLPLMIILTCHEFGHFLQSRRYKVRSSLPYFIPVPFGLLGTLGAVIVMDDRVPNSKALFDIGISGPLAGLVPTLIFLYWGIQQSYIVPMPEGELLLGDPLLMQWTALWIYGEIPPDMILQSHPFATAAWAGLLLTSLNLMPVGQLDGGHVFHSLLGKYSPILMKTGFYLAVVLLIYYRLWHWSLIILLLAAVGITHPPTSNDAMRLNWFRRVLGWATLAFVVIGFAPNPITFNDEQPAVANQPVWYCRLKNPCSPQSRLPSITSCCKIIQKRQNNISFVSF